MLISSLIPTEAISQLFLLIDSALYQAVSWLYNLFLRLAEAEIFTSEVYENFAQRVYVVLGVVMLFVLAYGLLQAIVNPDNFTKGDKSFSKVAMNLVVALIIIGLLPTVFDYSRKLQNFVLDSNLIGTLMFGGDDMEVEVCDGNRSNCHTQILSSSEVAKAKIDTYGNVMALTTLNAFLNPENYNIKYDASDYLANHGLVNPFSVVGCGLGLGGAIVVTVASSGALLPSISGLAVICGGLGAAGNVVADNLADVKNYTWNDIRVSILTEQNGGFSQILSLAEPLKNGTKTADGDKVQLTYMPFVSSACACLIIYLLISFCIDLGIRTVRLAFLQLIAPIPVFMKAMPGKGNQFDKWLKKTIATYLEVFIRIFLMYMVVYFLSNLNGNLNTREGLWVNVVIIMGLFAFVKEAPKLISEITGIDSGNMKIGIMPKLAAGGALAGAALVGGGLTAFTRNAVHAGKKVYGAATDSSAGFWQKAGNISKAALFGVGSTLTGGISGAIRGGYAGRGAKNIADVRKGAGTGAKGATDARDRHEAYRAAHPGHMGSSSFTDNLKGAWEWASGGFEAEEAKIKYYNDTLAVNDKAKKEATDLREKNSNNVALMREVGSRITWKGDPGQVAEYQRLFDGMKDTTGNQLSLEAIRSYVESLSKKDTTGMTDVQVREHSANVANYKNMLAQVEKNAWQTIQTAAYDSALAGTLSISDEKFKGIRAQVDQINNTLSAHGDPKVDLSNVGKNLDDAMTTIENSRNDLSAEVERKKAEREARQNNQGKK